MDGGQVVYCTSTYVTPKTTREILIYRYVLGCLYTLTSSYKKKKKGLNRTLATDKATTLFSFFLVLLPSHVLRPCVPCGLMTDHRGSI